MFLFELKCPNSNVPGDAGLLKSGVIRHLQLSAYTPAFAATATRLRDPACDDGAWRCDLALPAFRHRQQKILPFPAAKRCGENECRQQTIRQPFPGQILS
jgi:hypothetical protein